MTVYLVGAGPGDPGLITVRGAELLRRADVVVYDRLAPAALLDMVPVDAELVDVGKQPGRTAGDPARVDQDAINETLIDRARIHATVVRLKGGDPFVFGRGGEEAQALADAGIDFEIVPGVTAAIAAPAYAGVPLTFRRVSTSFTVVTGHAAEEESSCDSPGGIDWRALGQAGGTIVVLMGVTNRAEIARRLVASGRSPATPVCIVRWGTRADQSTIRTTLEGLPDVDDVRPPATMVIGEVAGLNLGWFEKRPLFGRSVVVTRARTQASGLGARLTELGAHVVELPVIEITPPPDGGAALRDALGRIGDYEWIILTSANALDALRDALEPGRDARALSGVKVAAIGSATSEALARWGIVADLVPGEFVGEALVDSLGAPGSPVPPQSGRILLVQAGDARDTVRDGLTRAGWRVDSVEAYRKVRPTADPAAVAAARSADFVTFTSGSTVDGFADLVGSDGLRARIACIGPVTAQRAKARGFPVDVIADPHTVDGLVRAVLSLA